jgi:hypothetical protein
MPSGAADSITSSRELGRHWMPLGQIHLSRRHREIIFGFRGNERSSIYDVCASQETRCSEQWTICNGL